MIIFCEPGQAQTRRMYETEENENRMFPTKNKKSIAFLQECVRVRTKHLEMPSSKNYLYALLQIARNYSHIG